jgi:hypothetical protein
LVNSLSGSYHINTGLLDFLGGLSLKGKIPLGFVDREVHVLKEIGFSEQDAISLISTVLLADFPDAFIKEIYGELERKYKEQFNKVPSSRLLIQYQRDLMTLAKGGSRIERHTTETVLNRVAVSAFIMDRLKDDPHFGRVKLEKCLYMLEATGITDLQGQYARKAAGPLDIEALYHKKFGIEAVGASTKVFRSDTIKAGRSKRVVYSPGPKFPAAVSAATEFLGTHTGRAVKLLQIMKKATTEQAEIIATVFAAWNDLLQAGVRPPPEVIIEVRKNWSETKQRFTPARLRIALNWLREMKLTPTGTGPRTLE